MKYIKSITEVIRVKLVVGLGNIGKEYEETRHNVGFMAIDAIAAANGVEITLEKFGGKYTILNKMGEKIILLKPQRFINLSGEVLKKYIDYFQISVDDIFVIGDDLDLPVGTFRLRYQGGSGGHNGLKNIELHLKTQKYKRMKIGISNNKQMDTKDYVLGKFSQEEKEKINEIIHLCPKIFDDYLTMTYDNVMNQYNKK